VIDYELEVDCIAIGCPQSKKFRDTGKILLDSELFIGGSMMKKHFDFIERAETFPARPIYNHYIS